MSRHRPLLVFAVFGCLFLATLTIPTPAHADTNSQYFPQTGHTVSGKFLAYWRTTGGLAVYGYPITDAANAVDPETGKTFLTQWFERRRFEYHPENHPPYDVLGGLIGKDLRRDALIADPDFVRYVPIIDPAYPMQAQRFFSETGHNLRLRFLEYWQQNGGLDRFGFPISEEHYEVDPETGKTFLMQWFERARFEYHPENTRPYDVLLGLLGNQIMKPKSSFAYQWKKAASRDALLGPFVLASDSQGSIYISDLEDPRIQKYDNTGHVLAVFGGDGTTNGLLSKEVRSIATDPQNNVYVLDRGTRRLQKFDSRGTFLRSWLVAGSDGEDQSDGALTIDRHGVVYVINTDSGKVQEFDGLGNLLRTVVLDFSDSVNPNDSREPLPDLIAVDSHGNIYIRDTNSYTGANAIRSYDATGHKQHVLTFNDLADFPETLVIDNQDTLYACGYYKHSIFTFNTLGKVTAQWGGRDLDLSNGRARCGLTVDAARNVFLASELENRIDRYSPAHTFVQTWGDDFSAPGKIAYPASLALAPNGDLYVLNLAFGRVNIYTQHGTKLASSWPFAFHGIPQDAFPAIAISPSGTVYISDPADQHIWAYDSAGHVQTAFGKDGSLYVPSGFPEDVSRLLVDAQGNLYLAIRSEIIKYDSSGTELLRWSNAVENASDFGLIAGMAMGTHNQLFVSSVFTGAVTVFDEQGHAMAHWPGLTSFPATMSPSYRIATDQKGLVYLTVQDGITVFDESGTTVAHFAGADSYADGGYGRPDAIAVDSDGGIYLTYAGPNLLMKFHYQ